MKKLWILPVFVLFLTCSCNDAEKKTEDTKEQADVAFNSYGQEISSEDTITSEEMSEKYKSMQPGDTIQVRFKTTINSVCKNKGCWMILDLPEEEEDVMVKFKDYGFFVPKDIEQKEVIVNGKAFIEEVSVEEQQHYAEDNGQTEAEIAAITQPKRTLSFLADGVLIKE